MLLVVSKYSLGKNGKITFENNKKIFFFEVLVFFRLFFYLIKKLLENNFLFLLNMEILKMTSLWFCYKNY